MAHTHVEVAHTHANVTSVCAISTHVCENSKHLITWLLFPFSHVYAKILHTSINCEIGSIQKLLKICHELNHILGDFLNFYCMQ